MDTTIKKSSSQKGEDKNTGETGETEGPQWFNNILVSSNNQMGFYLEGLKGICQKLISLCKILSLAMLGITLLYAILIWRNIPAAEPRDILVGWGVCLFLCNLGVIALEGKNSARLIPSLALIILLYWAPVAQISTLLKSI